LIFGLIKFKIYNKREKQRKPGSRRRTKEGWQLIILILLGD